MLKQLIIKNIILIESADISFQPGLNALSGETGSGKSAILAALSLIFGGKADLQLIRHGREKASIEAFFEFKAPPMLLHLLDEAGIHYTQDEGLIIKREMSANGKNRSFINNQAASLHLLKAISPFIGRIISQHASQWLLLTDKHRDIVDIYGNLQNERQSFSKSFLKESALKQELTELIQNEQQRIRDIEIYKAQIEEITEANIKNNEDEEVFTKYSFLANAENIASKADEIQKALTGGKTPFLTILSKLKPNFEYLSTIDSSLKDTAISFQNALLELEEVSYSLRDYLGKIECDPKKTQELSERLKKITKLKKKYGNTLFEIENFLKDTEKKLYALETVDEKIEGLQEELNSLHEENNILALTLSEKRKQAAKKLESAISDELKSLNMPKAIFEVCFDKIEKNKTGTDFIEFYMTPNLGEHKIPVKESASGGELSRILLAIQSILAENEKIPTLVFDEIDGNIGGETASIVGEKLKKMGTYSQVLCITHFPQVAKQADHHLAVSKKEEAGRTFTEVLNLKNKKIRLQEITRMMGGS